MEDEFSDFIVPMRDKPKEFGGNIPWTRIEDIEGKYLNGTLSNQYVTEDTVKKMNLKIIPKNSLIVSSSATFGVVAVVTQDLITNQTFIGLVPKEIETIDYWYAYFNSDEVKKYMRLQSAGSTIFYIARESFEKMPVTIPSKDEMIKIGQHFNNLDRLITLHQRKLFEAKNNSKNGSKKFFRKIYQKLYKFDFNFKTYDWEQRKFSDFTWNAGKRNKDDLDLEPYAITNEHGFIRQSEAHDDFGYMKDTDRKAYNIVMPNSFAYNPARINVGSIGYYEGTENVIVSSLYEVFQTADYVDDRFLWHWFKTEEFPRWIERLQEGSVRLYFYYDKLCECHMLMPSVPEQQKIAKSLDKLDTLITLHQREVFYTLKHIFYRCCDTLLSGGL